MKPFSSFVAVAFLTLGVSAYATSLTKYTAPDPISRDILFRPLLRVDEGASKGADPSATIHRNFPKIIEQNFARLDANSMAALVDTLTEAELSDLAQLYVNATTDLGLPPKLFYVLAHRLDANRLGRLSKHFGFAPIYAAVTAISPTKTQDFLASSNVNDRGAIPGEMRFGPDGRYAPTKRGAFSAISYVPSRSALRGGMLKTGGFGQFMNMTPYEIYLDFRTAPVGALGVTGALWETSVVLSSTLTVSYYSGYQIGTQVVAPLVQTYAPSLWDAIGSTIGSIVDTLSNSWAGGTAAAGRAQQSTAPTFESTGQQISDFGSFGGDYGAAQDWSEIGGGGGCAHIEGCRPTNPD